MWATNTDDGKPVKEADQAIIHEEDGMYVLLFTEHCQECRCLLTDRLERSGTVRVGAVRRHPPREYLYDVW